METGFLYLVTPTMTVPAHWPKSSPAPPPPPKPDTVIRNGRRYADVGSYPLPCDVKELSRQTLWHELSREVYGSCSSIDFKAQTSPLPDRVLEIGCGSGSWSAAMNDEFEALGKKGVQFTGVDVVDVCMSMEGVDWTFVKHDLMSVPLPFAEGEFDYVFARDIMLCVPAMDMYTGLISEVLRVLKPGGLLEIQCSKTPSSPPSPLHCFNIARRPGDYCIRTIQRTSASYIPGPSCYQIASLNTQFSPTSENAYITQWNDRVRRTLDARGLSAQPCTIMGPSLLMQENMVNVVSRRYALPLDTIWWESPAAAAESAESPSSSSTSSKRRSTGASSVESLAGSSERYRKRGGSTGTSRGTRRSSLSGDGGFPSPLTEDERAVRHLAKLTFVQLIEALEPVIRETCEVPEDEWDSWYRELMWSWFEGRGLRGGECLEVGAWHGRKVNA